MILDVSDSGSKGTLLNQVRHHVALSLRLRRLSTLRRKHLRNEVNRSRTSRRRRNLHLLRRWARARIVRFPSGEFTLHDLAHVNPALEPHVVRLAIADAIEAGHLSFILKKESCYPGATIMVYRKHGRWADFPANT